MSSIATDGKTALKFFKKDMIRLPFVLSAEILIPYRLRGQGTKTRGGLGKFMDLGPKIAIICFFIRIFVGSLHET